MRKFLPDGISNFPGQVSRPVLDHSQLSVSGLSHCTAPVRGHVTEGVMCTRKGVVPHGMDADLASDPFVS